MECQVCFEHFDATSFTPKILVKCGHSFCKICLERILNQKTYIICPICRETSKIVKKDSLPTNYSLIQIIEKSISETENKNLLMQYKYFDDKNFRYISKSILRTNEPKKLNLKKIINEDFIYVEEFVEASSQQISLFQTFHKRNRRYNFNRNSIFALFFNEFSFSIFMFRKSSKCQHSFSCLERIIKSIFYSGCIAVSGRFFFKKLFNLIVKDDLTKDKLTICSQWALFLAFTIYNTLSCVISYYIDDLLKYKNNKI